MIIGYSQETMSSGLFWPFEKPPNQTACQVDKLSCDIFRIRCLTPELAVVFQSAPREDLSERSVSLDPQRQIALGYVLVSTTYFHILDISVAWI